MFAGFLFYFGICIEILAITAVLFFLAKVKKDMLGNGFKWAGYILLVCGFLVLAGTLTRGVIRLAHHGNEKYENCGMRHGCPMMGRGHCCEEDDENCDMKEGKECCKDSMKMHHDMDMKGHEGMMKKDSTKK
jgi:hypothetical protein